MCDGQTLQTLSLFEVNPFYQVCSSIMGFEMAVMGEAHSHRTPESMRGLRCDTNAFGKQFQAMLNEFSLLALSNMLMKCSISSFIA